MFYRLRKLAGYLAVTLVLEACAVKETPVNEPSTALGALQAFSERQETRMGVVAHFPYPLPSLTPYYLDRYRGKELLSSTLIYKGWDMNHDGRIDMLEALNPQGQVIKRVYDLNFDGKVDEILKISPSS